jgi:hypothetical protein
MPVSAKLKSQHIRHYFVDEAGDGTLFSRKGEVIVGTPGCSRFFVLGLADVADPAALGRDLEDLRARLLTDPYFEGVPSMQPETRKTAHVFHAKDDLPEVRREVFSLLLHHEMRFFAVVRDKLKVVEYVRQRNERDQAYHYHPSELYDYLVRRLFRDRLHKDDEYNIFFARRGKADRTRALLEALEMARNRFSQRSGIISEAPIHVFPASPARSPGLQAADYFLWALQRLYERREERFVTLLWPLVSLVHDVDDTREARYGVYYTKKKPLTLAAIQDLPGI